MKREDGMLVSSKEEVKGVWKKHFECLMNGGAGGEAIVTSMGMEAGGKRVYEQRVIERVEVEKAIAKIKCGKTAGIDGITPKIVRHGGDTVVDWMTMISDLAWRQGEVPDNWKRQLLCHFTMIKEVRMRATMIGVLAYSVCLTKYMGEY